MTLIDQRILISRSPQVIWATISNMSRNPNWQTDCNSVSVLSTRSMGSGVRWRSTHGSSRETVCETTAWYEGLGYEYIYVDGAPFRGMKGRLRLQEIAEGTVVQWTISYEPEGVLGGLRNAMSARRKLENNIISSLKTLWKIMHEVRSESVEREVKSLMRDAPDLEARLNYRPRHSSAHTPEKPSVPVVRLNMSEPPIAVEDTKPHIPVPTALIAAPSEEVSTTPSAPVTSGIHTPHESVVPERLVVTEALPEAVRASLDTPGVPEALAVALTPAETPPTQLEEVDVRTDDKTPAAPLDTSLLVALQADPSKLDTAEISVFDLFGLPRPSQTQPMKALDVDALSDKPQTDEPTVLVGRVGLRLQQRRLRAGVKRPGI